MNDSYLRVGIITSMHGVHGEVKVFPTTDDPARFKKLKECIIEQKGEELTLKVRSVKFFKNQVILAFEGFDNRNDVEAFKDRELFVTRENAVPLDDDEFFICDIIGAEVQTDEGSVLGVLEDVFETGANDVYSVKTPDGKEVLLPAIKECILDVNVEEKKIFVHVMKGLI